MQRKSLLVAFLLLNITSIIVYADKPKIKGLSPEDAKNMKIDNTGFVCRDGSKIIPLSQVNDNFCDCEKDGSDEPGTSACPNGSFFCENKGFIGSSIFSSRVNDGICDCCDGSDEVGTASCPDTCRAEADKAFKHLKEELAAHKEGLKIKQEYIEEARQEIEEKTRQFVELTTKIAKLKADKAVEDQKREVAEAAEKQKREEVEARLIEQAALNQQSAGQENATDVGTVEENAVNVADETTKTEQPNLEEASEEEYEEVEEEVEEVVEEEEVKQEVESADNDPELAPLIEELKAIKNAIRDLEKDLSNAERDSTDIQNIIKGDYGENRAYYPLKGKCFEADTPEYTYEFCPFDKVTQKSKHGGHTSLGRWEGDENKEWNSKRQMIYTGGQRCWGGPDRSATIDLFCDKENRFADPAEPNKCEYTFKFFTPAACSEEQQQLLRDRLTVSGFSHDEL